MTRLYAWAAAVGAALVAILAALARRDARVRREAQLEGIEDAQQRVEAGRAAVADGRERGTPDERVRANDGRWR